jgi:hypothetical protein
MARGRKSNTSRASPQKAKPVVEEEEIEEVEIDEDEAPTNGTAKKNGFTTVDEVGETDMDEDLEEIELSSDEEDNDDDDVCLLVMKRPPVTSKQVDMLELGDDEDDTPMVEGGEKGSMNIKEREGLVKEYIETEGLGVLFSQEYGLVLFHLDNVWIEGKQLPPGRTREKLEVGTEVKFYDQSFEGEEYKELSADGVIHQAVAIWEGDRPDHLLKKVTEADYKSKLEEHRKSFMLYLRGEVFLRAALVRVKGEISGYLNDNIGIVDYDDGDKKHHVFFHVEDVKLFKKDMKEYKKASKQLLPVGVKCSVDARRVHISGVKGIEYQAVNLIVGPWPTTPHPTLLPGGQGSVAPSYKEHIPTDGTYTFYYLELALEAKLQRKVNQLKEVMGKSKGEIKYDWKNTATVSDSRDEREWREQFTGKRKGGRPRGEEAHQKEVFHAFRAAPEEELTEEALKSEVKREGKAKVTTKTVQERTWYSQEAWEHGGLRIKDEVKAEEEGGPQKKRVKKE